MSDKQPSNDNDFVVGDFLEPDESRTPEEFARNEELTIEQAAMELECSTLQVREWLASGALTSIPGGSIERIPRSEIRRIGNPDERAARAFEKEHKDE